ncbi:MAG TPA: transposase [Nitrososphaeria archaeon]|nr:transposase [Nitrososphaeria archaeon]
MGAPIIYDGSRVDKCSEGGEEWHRDVAATWNLLRRVPVGDGHCSELRWDDPRRKLHTVRLYDNT